MSHTESDRLAHNAHIDSEDHKAKVLQWLQENPTVGALNNGKYYVYPAGGEYREVPEFQPQDNSELQTQGRSPR